LTLVNNKGKCRDHRGLLNGNGEAMVWEIDGDIMFKNGVDANNARGNFGLRIFFEEDK
jgi:hypothetical protein